VNASEASPATGTRAASASRVLKLAAVAYAFAAVVTVGPASSRAEAYADGAPPGFTGGFGEQACDACHFEAAVNTKPGQLVLAGIPERYVAGRTYPLTLTLSRPGMAMGGFQLAARMESGGAQAGTLAPGPGDDARIRIENGTVRYANQRLAGTAPIDGDTITWTVIWTAPATAGAVLFHAAANAADKDEAARGDYVYTATGQSRPEP
jgi:hypothetical protein